MTKGYEKNSGNVFADLGFKAPERELLKARLTLQIFKLLKEQGRTQAGFADAIAEALRDDLAAKADIQLVGADLQPTKADLEAEIESAKSEIIKWMFGAIGFQTLIILGALAALARIGK